MILKGIIKRVRIKFQHHLFLRRRKKLGKNPNVINVGRRAVAKKFDAGGSEVFRKNFSDSKDGLSSFVRELLAEDLFGGLAWKLPLTRKGYIWFEMPLVDEEYRLDRIAPKLDSSTRIEIAKQSISILFDIFLAGYAHRDFHTRNLFWVENQLKLVDFECLEPYPEGERPAFPLCYDITGKGLESPFFTGNMGYSRKTKTGLSLAEVLRVSAERALLEFSKVLKDELHRASLTFTTREKEHICRAGRIYSSFELPYFKVSPDETQRNSQMRLEDFGITRETIEGKTILDLGSNAGGMLFAVQKYGPKRCVGIEHDIDKVVISEKIGAYNGLSNVEFIQVDIDFLEVSSLGEPFDVVFCLAIEAHVKKRQRLFELLSKLTGDILYFEGNSAKNTENIKKSLRRAGFVDVRFLGTSQDDFIPANNCRPLFFARKRREH